LQRLFAVGPFPVFYFLALLQHSKELEEPSLEDKHHRCNGPYDSRNNYAPGARIKVGKGGQRGNYQEKKAEIQDAQFLTSTEYYRRAGSYEETSQQLNQLTCCNSPCIAKVEY